MGCMSLITMLNVCLSLDVTGVEDGGIEIEMAMLWATLLWFWKVQISLMSAAAGTKNMDSVALQKFKGQVGEFSHHLSEFELVMT